ncbi:hypothetical protein EYR40_001651 [Pleurotus pulmonarius]|nr:hypothetical protein EYR40_001651 [Pleurotus pulmonarius]
MALSTPGKEGKDGMAAKDAAALGVDSVDAVVVVGVPALDVVAAPRAPAFAAAVGVACVNPSLEQDPSLEQNPSSSPRIPIAVPARDAECTDECTDIPSPAARFVTLNMLPPPPPPLSPTPSNSPMPPSELTSSPSPSPSPTPAPRLSMRGSPTRPRPV